MIATIRFHSFWGGGINSTDFQLGFGRVSFDTPPVADAPDQNFTKLTLRAVRLQNLMPGRIQGYAAVRVQKAFNNLDVTEQFRAGGPDGVRAFAPGDGTGDSGALATLELRLIAPADMIELVGGSAFFSLFADWATVERRNDTSAQNATFQNRVTYGSLGVGVVWNGPSGWELRASLAEPRQGPVASVQDRDTRFYVQLRKQF